MKTTSDVELTEPTIACDYLPEPLLAFAQGGRHVDPKEGIARYGPLSSSESRHPGQIRVATIGTADTTASARGWLARLTSGVPGDAKHPEFPGMAADRGFMSTIATDDAWDQLITQAELDSVCETRGPRQRFEHALTLLGEKTAAIADGDQRIDYVLVALPPELYQRARVADYHEAGGMVHRDLRRAYKAAAMKYRLPTQFLRQGVADGRDKDHPSKIAWNFATAMYLKAGGVPWGATGLTHGTCYLGISFYRPLRADANRVQASLVHAFDEYGDGLVLRGQEFEWDADREGSKAPHLTTDQATALTEFALARYVAEVKRTPARVVVHKSSRYWVEEREGFRRALAPRVNAYDLLALEPQHQVRLFAESKYPPLRGTHLRLGDLDFLYTTGFLADLGEYHSIGVPSPVLIADHVGQDRARDVLLREILILTKMNWNSARLGGLLPITLRFSRLFGDIMKEIPGDREPLTQFKYYV